MSRASSLLDELEQAERAATGPPPEVADRMWSAIARRLAQEGPPPEQPTSGPTPEPGPVAESVGVGVKPKGFVGPSGPKGLVGLALTSAVVGLLAWSLREGDAPEREDGLELVVEPEAATPEAPPWPRAVIPTQIPQTRPRLEPGAQHVERIEAPVRAKPAASKREIGELELMYAIEAALADRDSTKALSLIAKHRRDFPNSKFVQERLATEARALCLGGDAAGWIKAEQFARRWPKSIHVAAILDACAPVAEQQSPDEADRSPG